MSIDYNIVKIHKTEMSNFGLKWRFVDDNYNNLPLTVLNQLVTLNAEGAEKLSDILVKNGVHIDFPFNKRMFDQLIIYDIELEDVAGVRRWLNGLGLNRDEPIYLHWSDKSAMVTSWGIVIDYYDDFFYPGSDDLTIFDSSLNWAVLFFHESQIYFGTNS
ncbi:hypothetical protein [Neolewinella xylanilytica]|uniref:hypothetical protein n=1 Tax=Neolewinella xylanilytica TaxID=1514080 RepID=UPI000CEAD6BA|nr:hypothetical protein [Neolewinella xylanilytica]